MTEKMILTKALDERDFLYKKITSDITSLQIVTVKRKCDPNTLSGLSVDDFVSKAKSSYQSIIDNIDRYKRLCAAIVLSNATTTITIDGEEITVAAAIKLRDELKGVNNQSLDKILVARIRAMYSNALSDIQDKNDIKDKRKDSYIQSIIAGSGSSKDNKISAEDLELAEKSVDGLTPEFIDPLNIKEILDTKFEHLERVIDEINTAIKISNATTEIEF